MGNSSSSSRYEQTDHKKSSLVKNLERCVTQSQLWDNQLHYLKDLLVSNQYRKFESDDDLFFNENEARFLVSKIESLVPPKSTKKEPPLIQLKDKDLMEELEAERNEENKEAQQALKRMFCPPVTPASRIFALASNESISFHMAHKKLRRDQWHEEEFQNPTLTSYETINKEIVLQSGTTDRKERSARTDHHAQLESALHFLFPSLSGSHDCLKGLDLVDKASMTKEDASTRFKEESMAKYLYIHHFYEKLTGSAQKALKLKVAIEDIEDQLARYDINQMSALNKRRLEKRLREAGDLLKSTIYNLDRSKRGLNWLIHNFSLEVALFSCNNVLNKAQLSKLALLDSLKKGTCDRTVDNDEFLAALINNKVRLETVSDREKGGSLRKIEKMIHLLNMKKLEIYEALEDSEKEALLVGMDGLDSNLNGYLTADETKELSAKTFKFLSGGKDMISHEDLFNCISQLQHNMRAKKDFIQILRRNIQLLHRKGHLNEYEISEMERMTEKSNFCVTEYNAEKKMMKSITQYFLNAFSFHLFGKCPDDLVEEMKSKAVTSSMIDNQVEEMEHDMKEDLLFINKSDRKFRKAMADSVSYPFQESVVKRSLEDEDVMLRTLGSSEYAEKLDRPIYTKRIPLKDDRPLAESQEIAKTVMGGIGCGQKMKELKSERQAEAEMTRDYSKFTKKNQEIIDSEMKDPPSKSKDVASGTGSAFTSNFPQTMMADRGIPMMGEPRRTGSGDKRKSSKSSPSVQLQELSSKGESKKFGLMGSSNEGKGWHPADDQPNEKDALTGAGEEIYLPRKAKDDVVSSSDSWDKKNKKMDRGYDAIDKEELDKSGDEPSQHRWIETLSSLIK